MTMPSGWLCARRPRAAGFSGALATRGGRVKTSCSVNARSKSHPDDMVAGLRKKRGIGYEVVLWV